MLCRATFQTQERQTGSHHAVARTDFEVRMRQI